MSKVDAALPRFSIVMPVFNCAEFLRLSLDSLVRQSFGDWEAVCVDDGSTDGSAAVLDEYARRDPRFRVIHQANAGVAAARNAALKFVRGEWVGFLDGDDMFDRRTFLLVDRAVRELPVSEVVGFGTKLIDGDATDFGASDGGAVADVRACDMSERLPNFALSFGFATRFYRRDLIEGCSFPPYRVGEDLVFMIAAMVRAKHAAWVPAALYGYRRPEGRNRSDLAAVCDIASFSRDALRILVQSDRPVAAIEFRRYLKNVAKRTLCLIASLPAADAEEAWSVWLEIADELASLRGLPAWWWFRLRLARRIRCRLLARLLFRAF